MRGMGDLNPHIDSMSYQSVSTLCKVGLGDWYQYVDDKELLSVATVYLNSFIIGINEKMKIINEGSSEFTCDIVWQNHINPFKE